MSGSAGSAHAGAEAMPQALAEALRRIGPSLAQVESTMREQLGAARGAGLGSESLGVLRHIGEHVLEAGGKRLRPALLMLAAELCGYAGPRRVQIAAAVELLHTATLLHDDVVDLSDTRRGRAAARAIWGNRRAVLVGDFFYARASAMVVEDGDPDVLWIFADTIARMAEGELLQLEKSFEPGVSEAHYHAVIERKSASLTAAAAEAGAILGGVTRAERRRVAEFGREFGLAFQLRDDALDYGADAQALGKPPHADLREGKVTLPLILTLKRCSAAERDAVAALLKTAARRAAQLGDASTGAEPSGAAAERSAVLEESEIAPVLELVQRHRGALDTDRRAQEHVARAAAAIAPFPDGPARRALLAAADYAAARTH
ncbi:MAG: polyprenyl synthetase family protein [Deltaproteobacteria bacterium]|nr:polyprenyl synthetase family protein [Deltaproteobacteria bacterium]